MHNKTNKKRTQLGNEEDFQIKQLESKKDLKWKFKNIYKLTMKYIVELN